MNDHIVWVGGWVVVFGVALRLFGSDVLEFCVLMALFIIGIVATRIRYYYLGLCRRYEK